MPASCCVVGCVTRRQPKGSGSGVSLFRIPANLRQRRAWVARKNWEPKSWERVCSKHFVTGWPSDDRDDVDYRPTLLMKGTDPDVVSEKQANRKHRASKRSERRHLKEVAEVFALAAEQNSRQEEGMKRMSLVFHDYCIHGSGEEEGISIDTEHIEEDNYKHHKDVQTDLTMGGIASLQSGRHHIQRQLAEKTWGIHKIKDNNDMTKFYTGLPSFAIFMWLFKFLEPKATRMDFWGQKVRTRCRTGRTTMSLIDQFLFVLIRLKVGLFLQDLADRFSVSVSTLSRIFNTWVLLMEKELETLTPFPTTDITARTLPACFSKFTNIRCIIDCTELFIERASSLTAQSLTFSNYKHHNTVKFLVVIVPTGGICYVSAAWGGRVSDRCITEKCGFLDHILPGDLIMADKGFTIGDLLAKKGAHLQIPPFLASKGQFTPKDIELTRQIARVRIHVERAIGRVKQFHILDPVIPLSLSPTISSVFRVCCFLANLSPPLVS